MVRAKVVKNKSPHERVLLKNRYIVESLCASRMDPLTKKSEVLVKWRGYPASASTWEPYEHLYEDGFGDQLRDLMGSGPSDSRSYVFIVRFRNTLLNTSVYRRLHRFLKESNVQSIEHIPGNVHTMLHMRPESVPVFTRLFREWIASVRPTGCVHAHLMKLAYDHEDGDTSAIQSVYPPVMATNNDSEEDEDTNIA